MDIQSLYQLFLDSNGICTDTRKIKEGCMFFALKGPSFNGNDFAKGALQSGAKFTVVDEKEVAVNDRYVLVDDVLKTLQQLSTFHRNQFNIPFIAIAGSNGKTTTKELTAAVLCRKYRTFSTQGNLNNHIGVPLTLLSVTKETEIAVIELGANHLGETALLSSIARSDYGIITNNGKDHLEGYGSIEGVRKGNGELFDFMMKNKRTVFVSAAQQDLMTDSSGIKRVIFGNHEKAIVTGTVTQQFPTVTVELTFENKERVTIPTHLTGKYNLENILAAAAFGFYFKVPIHQIAEAISNYKPANNRSQIVHKNSNVFFLDAYNANPTSMSLAIENFAEWNVKNKVVILGEMLELGSHSINEHRAILSLVGNKQFDKVILVGEEFRKAITKSPNSFLFFSSVDELKRWFTENRFSDTHFLLKGSRLNKLEKLLED